MSGHQPAEVPIGGRTSAGIEALKPEQSLDESQRASDRDPWWRGFPWWAILLGLILTGFAYFTIAKEDYNEAFQFIRPGLWITVRTTLIGFALAVGIGLVAGLARISRNVVASNIARTYIEFIRGVPTLPLLFFMAFVIMPDFFNLIGQSNQAVPTEWRGVIVLALVYGGFIAEIIRGGVQSIPLGQMEAGRTVGLSYGQTMRHIILPQAMRSVLPPLGNDFIAMLKDTSLLSLLAVRELTQNAKLWTNASFQPRETYIVLTFIYLVLVTVLSFALARFERYMTRNQRNAR